MNRPSLRRHSEAADAAPLCSAVRQIRVDVFLGERLPRERRRLRRKRLRRRASSRPARRTAAPAALRSARSVAPGLAIEHEQEALNFVACATTSMLRPFWRSVSSFGACGQVVVPQIVVHQLVMPEPLAGARVERDERCCRTGCCPADRRRRNRSARCRSGMNAMPRSARRRSARSSCGRRLPFL